ncbi:MAG: hypothetical protein JNM18_18105 [Planctomycetaceae bacterium]|nr:hypothetical protein [Planctomycetaceae bacterium]
MAQRKPSNKTKPLTVTKGPIVDTGIFKTQTTTVSGDLDSWFDEQVRKFSFATVNEKLDAAERMACHILSLPREDLEIGEADLAAFVRKCVGQSRQLLNITGVDEFKLCQLLLTIWDTADTARMLSFKQHEKPAVEGAKIRENRDRIKKEKQRIHVANKAVVRREWADSRKLPQPPTQDRFAREFAARTNNKKGRNSLGIQGNKRLRKGTVLDMIKRGSKR